MQTLSSLRFQIRRPFRLSLSPLPQKGAGLEQWYHPRTTVHLGGGGTRPTSSTFFSSWSTRFPCNTTMNTPADHQSHLGPLEYLEHPGSSLFIPVRTLHPTDENPSPGPSSMQGAARAPILNPYEAFANETYRNPRSIYCLSMGLWEKAKESCGYRRRFVRWIRRSDTEMLELAKEDWGKILRGTRGVPQACQIQTSQVIFWREEIYDFYE